MKVGFIGAGNMGGAIAKAVSASALQPEIILADYSREKAEELAAQIGASVSDNVGVVSNCDYVFLGVKPQVLRGVLQQLAPVAAEKKQRTVFVSMAAGVTMATILEIMGSDTALIRIMPNTPVSVGSGMILFDCSSGVTESEKQNFLSIMERAGRIDCLPESLIDAGCAVSGCGPAFAFLFAEALADGGVTCGLPRNKAVEYAAQMLYGAADLILATGKHPGELKDAVCSPGGSTIKGVLTLEEHGFRGAVMDAVIAAYKRTVELG